MRRFCLLLFVAFLSVAIEGCGKEKRGPARVPPTIHRVTYSDVDSSGTVNAGDTLIVAFDRHITVTIYPVDNVFELSGAGDDFGSGATMEWTSGHAITITLGTDASLTASADGYITSQVRVVENCPVDAIKDSTWGTSVTGGGTFSSIEGRLGYAAPLLASAVYADTDTSGTVTQGDTVTLSFTGTVELFTSSTYLPGRTFILPVDLDNFGSGATAQKTSPTTVVITVGAGATFDVPGTHTVGDYDVDSPSGIDIAINIENGLLTYNVGGAQGITVPPRAVDIQ